MLFGTDPEFHWYNFIVIESPIVQLIKSARATPKVLVIILEVDDLEQTRVQKKRLWKSNAYPVAKKSERVWIFNR